MPRGKEAPRDKIKRAAVKIFAQKGFSGSSAQEIADEAGVNKSMLFYYFQSKENLFYSIFREQISENRKKIIEAISKADTPLGKLKAIIDYEVKLYADVVDIDFFRIIVKESCISSNELLDYFKSELDTYVTLIGSIISDGVSDGSFRNLEPEMLAKSLLACNRFFIHERLVFGKEIPKEKLTSFFNTLFVEGLML